MNISVLGISQHYLSTYENCLSVCDKELVESVIQKLIFSILGWLAGCRCVSNCHSRDLDYRWNAFRLDISKSSLYLR